MSVVACPNWRAMCKSLTPLRASRRSASRAVLQVPIPRFEPRTARERVTQLIVYRPPGLRVDVDQEGLLAGKPQRSRVPYGVRAMLHRIRVRGLRCDQVHVVHSAMMPTARLAQTARFLCSLSGTFWDISGTHVARLATKNPPERVFSKRMKGLEPSTFCMATSPDA